MDGQTQTNERNFVGLSKPATNFFSIVTWQAVNFACIVLRYRIGLVEVLSYQSAYYRIKRVDTRVHDYAIQLSHLFPHTY